MADMHSIESTPEPQFKYGRPIYTENGSTLTVQFPHQSIYDRRRRIAEEMEALTLLITANDGEDFNCMADDFQLTIRHMLSGMATELDALCDVIEEV
ncbi:hypothetical protein [Pusillimonas sp.]|uniref:hypothetical protein n=1 Tax=Pusillimonas sp. TaxID=3040095 RepID=UPI0037C9E9AD